MATLKVTLKSANNMPGCHKYDNSVNSDNYKEVALIFTDLSNYGVPIEKSFKEFLKIKKSDWDAIIGT